MIKENKKPCWIGLCDNCNEDLFGMDFVSHLNSKKEILERIKEEIEMDCIEVNKENHFCSQDCEIAFRNKKECEQNK